MQALRIAVVATTLVCVGLWGACSSSGNKPSEPPRASTPSQTQSKEPVQYTAQEAFTRMAGMANRWAADALPVRLESDLTSETNGQNGKSTVWRAVFVSPSRAMMRVFVCSGSRLREAPAFGVTSAADQAYGPDVAALIFQSFYLKTDSDKAFEVAQQHGGANVIKKDPNQPVIYILEWNPKQHVLLWNVIYGRSRAEAQGIGIINAMTGAFLGAGK